MSHLDSRGLPLSTTSDGAAERYRQGVDLLLSAWPGAAEALEDAIAADPHFALAHAARARLHVIRAELGRARARIAMTKEMIARRGTERERSHVEILSLAINGQSAKALERALMHADSRPRDILILSLPLGAFGLFAFSGMADHDQARVDLCERQARHFDPDDWWFLTYQGWAHVENGNVTLGRALTQRTYDMRRNNANAAHALSHAMSESGAGKDAEKLIADWLPGYDRAGMLHGHIAWHAALSALERGNAERALAIYADYIQPSVSAGVPVNIVSDTASFLWRFQAYGHMVPTGLECHRPEERTRVQSLNDLMVFGTMALGSFSSGSLLTTYGWDTVLLVSFFSLALAIAALGWGSISSRQPASRTNSTTHQIAPSSSIKRLAEQALNPGERS